MTSTGIESDAWAATAFHVMQSLGLELIIFAVTVCVALAIRSGDRVFKPLRGKTVMASPPPSPEVKDRVPASASPRKPPNRSQSFSAIVNEIVEGMREQQNIRFAHRALHLYEELRFNVGKDGQQFQEAIKLSQYSADELYTVMVHCAVRAGRHHVIEGLIEDMIKQDLPRSMNFYECTMKQLAGQKQYNLALKVYERMDADRLEPSAVTLSCLIGFAAEVGELDRAVGFFERLLAMTTPSIRAYMTVLRVHAKRQDWTTSVQVLRSMAGVGVMPDCLALNVVLATGVAADRLEAVSEFLEEINGTSMGKAVDIVSYNTVIKGYAQHGDAAGAIKAIDQLCKRGLIPNAITFNTAMDGAVRGCRFNEAFLLLEKMRSFGIAPDKFSCSILVKGLGRCLKDRVDHSTERLPGILNLLEQVDAQLDGALRTSLYHSLLEYAMQVPNSTDVVTKVFTQMRRLNVALSAPGQRLLLQALPKGLAGFSN